LAETASRTALENALFLYAPPGCQAAVTSFLEGLAVDELRYLAEFFGSCILTSSAANLGTWDLVGHRIEAAQRKLKKLRPAFHEDTEHKLLLVTEFAARCGRFG
jgi:hypothetical protein